MAKLEGRLVDKFIARLRDDSSLGSNPDASQKYKMGDISKR